MRVRGRLVGIALVVASACVASTEQHYPLTTGTWVFEWADVVEDACFPTGVPVPRGIGIYVFVGVTGGDVAVTGPEEIPGMPAMTGTQNDEGRFDVEGDRTLVVTTACSLEVSTRALGVGVAPGLAGLTFEIAFSGSPGSDCSALEGETIDNFPFPALSEPASGSCALVVKGLADFEEPWF